PSGVSKPIRLARLDAVRPDEVVVFQPGDDNTEPRKFPVPRAADVTIHTANLVCVMATPTVETLMVGTACMDWKDGARSATWWGDVKAWDLKTGTVRFADAWDGNQVLALACSANGKLIAAAGGHATTTLLGGDRYQGRVVCWEENFEKKRFDLTLPE